MDRWEIRAAPNADDPQRHLLLLRGGVADVAAVLKQFGALCGRPTPLNGEEFNLSFVLHKVTPEVRKRLDDWLSRMSPKSTVQPTEPSGEEVSLPRAVRKGPTEPSGEAASPTTFGNGTLSPTARSSEESTPVPEKEPLVSLGPDAAPIPTETRMATPPAGNSAAAPSTGGISTSTSLADALRADWTFETLLVGAYNRFAHAAAMSVVTSPGSMYNPLFLYGVPGTGKSHLLYAMAHAMSKGLGDASLLVTSGARLSRAVSAAAARGEMASVDKKTAGSTAIFVDDIHLLAVTDQNKELLAGLFKSFFDRGRQVVISSMYPPKALGTLEEALGFSFSKGWSVDLKIPSPNVQRDLVLAVADRVGAQLSGDEIGLLADKLTIWGYQDLTLWAQRLALLRKMRSATGQSVPMMDMLRLIYEPIVIGSEAPPVSTAGASFTPPAATAGSEPLAIIAPKGQDGIIAYVANLFYEAGVANGFTGAYRHELMETYDAMQQVGVPFQIADICHRAGVTRALIVGPGPDSPLAPRANEFGHAVRRILDSSGIATGWIPHAQLHLAAHYVNAHLDFEK